MNAFHTLSGLVVRAVTAAQMLEVDRVATTQVGPNLYQMMENAGRNLASLAVEMLGDGSPTAPILVLAGTGGDDHPSPLARRIRNRVAFWGPVLVVDNS